MPVAMLALAMGAAIAERRLEVDAFHAIEIRTRATVEIRQAPVSSVVVSGDPRLVQCVGARIMNGRLVIGLPGPGFGDRSSTAAGGDIVVTGRRACPRVGDVQRLRIQIAAPLVDDVVIREHDIVKVSPMVVPAFAARITGRGEVAIDGLRANRTHLSVSGMGRVVVSGTLGQLTIAIPGEGSVDARAAEARALDLSIAGHGNVVAAVNGSVIGSVAGRGTVAVGGCPTCAIRKLGTGRIICPAAM